MSRRRGAPWRHRPHHRAFYALPAAARQLAVDAFRRGMPTTAIAEAIRKDHDAAVAVSSLNRYREWWESTERPVLEAAEKTEELVAAFKDHPNAELEQVIRQLLMAQRLTAMTEDRKPKADDLGWLDVAERKLRLEERRLELRERQLEAKVAKAAGAVERELKKKNLDAETMARIKQEIYGIPA